FVEIGRRKAAGPIGRTQGRRSVAPLPRSGARRSTKADPVRAPPPRVELSPRRRPAISVGLPGRRTARADPERLAGTARVTVKQISAFGANELRGVKPFVM